MADPWYEVVYEGRYFIPLLNDSNWQEWNGCLFSALEPFETVVEILLGTIDICKPLYSATIDTELFFFIVRNTTTDLNAIAWDVRSRCGLRGSALYQTLREGFAEVQNATLSEPNVEKSPDAKNEEAGYDGDSVQTRQSIDEDKGTDWAEISRLLSFDDKDLNKNFSITKWAAWKLDLGNRLSDEDILVLTGIKGGEDASYCEKIDERLFLLMQWLIPQEFKPLLEKYEVKIKEKGNKLFKYFKNLVLDIRAEWIINAVLPGHPSILETERETHVVLKLVHRAAELEYGCHFTSEEEKDHFVQLMTSSPVFGHKYKLASGSTDFGKVRRLYEMLNSSCSP